MCDKIFWYTVLASMVSQVKSPCTFSTLWRFVQVWDAHAALAFLSMCRAYKPLLAAQRQQATLVGILDFLQPLVRQCSTAQLATLLLDLAFIGCQSFKSHPLLSEVSMELYGRVQAGTLTADNAVELADAIRALDKLDHCHDALSRAAGVNPTRQRISVD